MSFRPEQPACLGLRRYDSLEDPGLISAWSRLSETVPGASVFTTHAWCRCWLETVARDATPEVLVARDDRGEAVGLAGLCIARHNGVRWLRFMGRERVSGDHLDLLVRPEHHAACLRAMLAQIETRADEFDGLLLGELAPTSPTLAGLIHWAEARGFAWIERERRRLPFIDLPSSFDGFLAGLSSNMRYHVRRRRRGLDRLGNARVELVRDGPAVDDVLSDFFVLHERRWQRDGLPGNFGDPAMQAFLRRYCRSAAEQGLLRLSSLTVDGRREGVLIALHYQGRASYYQMGWNPECPVDSPGVVILSQSIEQAIAEGLTRYDFLRGEEVYKLRWTNWAAEQTTAIVGWNMAARAAMAAEKLKNGVKTAVTRCLGPDRWEQACRLVTGAHA
jgi:CelD/BcsL family acetyltransferase involved in cellulose biosynthesis